jgi:cytochrome bd-type quinol oxidase subunit 2
MTYTQRLIIGFSILLTPLFAMFVLALNAQPVHAQAEEAICQGAGGTFSGGTCTPAGDNAGDQDPFESGIFASIVSTVAYVIGAISVLMIVIGGLRYVISQGDAQATQNAKNTILYAVVGLVVAFVAFGLVEFVLNRLEA